MSTPTNHPTNHQTVPKYQLFNIYYTMYLISESKDPQYKENYRRTLQTQINTYKINHMFDADNLLSARHALTRIYDIFKPEIDGIYHKNLKPAQKYYDEDLSKVTRTLFVNMYRAKPHKCQHFNQSNTDFALLNHECSVKYSLHSTKTQNIRQALRRLKKTDFVESFDKKQGEDATLNMVIYEHILRCTNHSYVKGDRTKTIMSPILEELDEMFDNQIQNIDDIPETPKINSKYDEIVKIPFKNYKKFLKISESTEIRRFNGRIIGQKDGVIYIKNTNYSSYGQREYKYITQIRKRSRNALFDDTVELDIVASNESIIKLGQHCRVSIDMDPFYDRDTKIKVKMDKGFKMGLISYEDQHSLRPKFSKLMPLMQEAVKPLVLVIYTGAGGNAALNVVYKALFKIKDFSAKDYSDALEVNNVLFNKSTPNYFLKGSKFYGQDPKAVHKRYEHIQIITGKLKEEIKKYSSEGVEMVSNIMDREAGSVLDTYIRGEIRGKVTKAKWMSVYTTIIEKGFRNYALEKIKEAGGEPLFQCHDAVYCDMSNANTDLLGTHSFLPFVNFKGTKVKS